MTLAVVPDLAPAGAGWTRPPLRLVEPVHPRRRPGVEDVAPARRITSRVRRRRLVAAVIVLTAVVALALPVRALAGTSGTSGTSVTSGTPGAAAGSTVPVEVRAGQGTFYVVRPGDTLRSIASRLSPAHPARAEAALAAALGSDTVVPGEHVPVS